MSDIMDPEAERRALAFIKAGVSDGSIRVPPRSDNYRRVDQDHPRRSVEVVLQQTIARHQEVGK